MSAPALVAFSPYLSGRNQLVLALAAEILELLDRSEHAGPERRRASDSMWLWTLGAYEITRTICQAYDCFTPSFLAAASSLKSQLEHVRVPNTKMERVQYDRKERPVAVTSHREPDEWDPVRLDLRVGDPNHAVSARDLLASYIDTMATLRPEDVLQTHEAAFERKTR